MKIVLDQPFAVGDLSEDTYPHVYITTFYSNGPAMSVTVTYEVGELQDPDDKNPVGFWNKSPYVQTGTLAISGADLAPFFYAKVANGSDDSPYLWDQVELLLYQQIQKQDPRLAGKLA